MARVAICWELGQGLGHIASYLDLCRHLVERGDKVYFLAKEPQRAREVFAGLDVDVGELTRGNTDASVRINPADSYPEILFNCGFAVTDDLHVRVQRISHDIKALGAEILICDFAPTVMLANLSLRLPLIHSGNGYCVPIRNTPMPRFRYWLGPRPPTLLDNEARVLAVINDVLARCGHPPLNSVAELLNSDIEWLRTFEEFDFYHGRGKARYLGTFASSEFGVAPSWVSEHKPRVFAYLDQGPTTPLALHALAQLDIAVCLYAPSLSVHERTVLDPEIFHVSNEPISIPAASRNCACFVTNGNLNTVVGGVLAGIPQFVLPSTAERYLTGRRLELLGAGLAAPLNNPGDVKAKLRAVLNDAQFARAARKFASKYSDSNPNQQLDIMLREIDELAGRSLQSGRR
jgi:hypothetical protein